MSTIAIISDIHANAVSLAVVLADLERAQPDRVVCLGDVAATGPQPVEVMRLLAQMDDWQYVRGNCDDKILRVVAGEADSPPDEHEAIDHWCAGKLPAADLATVASFQPVVTFDIDGVGICCYHGSPRSNLDELLPDTPEHDVVRWLRGHHATVYCGGHTHVQMVRRWRDAYVINPGSVGLPFMYTADGGEINPCWAEYALLRIDDGRVGVDLRRVPVQREALLAAAAASEMPHKDWWSSDWT